MRLFVQNISSYAKSFNANFYIIPQNGVELLTVTGEENANPDSTYLQAIDGNGQEDLFYGYNNDDEATPNNVTDYLINYLNISQNFGNLILTTDYCSTHSKMDDSYQKNSQHNFVSFAADSRELDDIPDYPLPIHNENDDNISNLSQVKNFLYIINPDKFNSKEDFINARSNTNYDLIIMDLFFKGLEFTSSEIGLLKTKANGGQRLVISYMSIGEAEDYRYYWQDNWNAHPPEWIAEENPEWEGNYKVKYWDKDWQNIIFGNDTSYLKKIIDAGFDGVYLDIIDAFDYFE